MMRLIHRDLVVDGAQVPRVIVGVDRKKGISVTKSVRISSLFLKIGINIKFRTGMRQSVFLIEYTNYDLDSLYKNC